MNAAPESAPAARTTPALELGLREVLARALADDGVRVQHLRQLTGGASRETWYLEAVGADAAARPLILRRDPLAETTSAGFATEAAVLRAARDAGVPEPAVLAHSDDPAVLGAPFVLMEWIEGETLARRILRDDAFAAVRPRLAEQCGEILAHIHAIDADAIPALEPFEPVGLLRGLLDGYEERSPAFELGLRWLEAHRPAPVAPTVVHGDFRNGNLIVGPDGVRAVLDWELVHVGDPMEDLGYLCARVWRFGGAGPVGGFGAYDDLFRGYEQAGGRRVDPDAVLWWEVWSALRWGTGCLHMAHRHLSGELRSVEMAAIGRRIWEQEYDLLLLIEHRLRSL
jgi:aminoglycoside phosphotransferase (APT) family kinase protein